MQPLYILLLFEGRACLVHAFLCRGYVCVVFVSKQTAWSACAHVPVFVWMCTYVHICVHMYIYFLSFQMMSLTIQHVLWTGVTSQNPFLGIEPIGGQLLFGTPLREI